MKIMLIISYLFLPWSCVVVHIGNAAFDVALDHFEQFQGYLNKNRNPGDR